MIDQIKPCPFCGGMSRIYWDRPIDCCWLQCAGCEAEGPVERTEEKAIAAWNAAPRMWPKPLTPAERAVLDAAVAYREAMDRRWKGPPSEDLERKGKVRLALNMLLGGARALARERREGGSDG